VTGRPTPATPRVTFVVPTYNYARFVGQAVDSLLAQTFRAIEVIVIDDASTDGTPEVLAGYAGDPRVRVIRHGTNTGHITTYNEGIAAARGEFVGLLSADDLCLDRDAVRRQVALFDSDPEIGFVYPAQAYVDESGKLVHVAAPWPDDHVSDGLEELGHLIYTNYVPASGPLSAATTTACPTRATGTSGCASAPATGSATSPSPCTATACTARTCTTT
jgi:glycosyltransferase involved in cell wall biosynthesis